MGLLYKINEIQGIERIRFVTSHPKDLSNDLIHAMRDLDKVCEHIHLPLQSGSTRILKLMNRNYGYEDYLRQIDLLRKTIPSISITTDIIAGFPQESEEDHSLTMRALKDIGFDGIFAFNYSPRPGTKASEFTGHIDEDVSSRRLYEILDLQTAITDQKNKELEDTIQEVLIEEEVVNTKGRVFTGRTRSNKIVNVTLIGQVGTGDTVNVRIIKTNRHSMEAVVLST
jgi:tRNA-2-methylthio-N6-dimethylallyladenosine synthase